MQRLIAYVARELPTLTPEKADAIENAIRREYGGEEVYVARSSAHRRLLTARRIHQLFNGHNAADVARELGISKTTVYRVLRQQNSDKSA